mmetsp:Transcript_100940/g.200524  ORF Transcript_100940/g.200524 Transcript_100940/m.200524 type:complete len:344 (-) Transcript_100940:29-1060(-)
MACWRGICRCVRSHSGNALAGEDVTHPLTRAGRGCFADHYSVADCPLGEGSFSTVLLARCRHSGMDRAVKRINKGVEAAPENETDLLIAMDHENIVRLFETFEDQQHYYLVKELLTGSDLLDRIVEVGKLSEPQAAAIMRQIVQSVCYMHQECIVHRDLKPDNFVWASKGPLDSTPLKLVDFGLSRRFSPGEVLKTAVGTVLYAAPEVFSQSYSPLCDLWSLGVIMYCLLCGHPPFDGKTARQTAKSIRKGIYSLQGDEWDLVSESAKDLIRGLLTKEVTQRCTESQVLSHNWIVNLAACSSGEPLGDTMMQKLRDLSMQNKRARDLQKRMAEELASKAPGPR